MDPDFGGVHTTASRSSPVPFNTPLPPGVGASSPVRGLTKYHNTTLNGSRGNTPSPSLLRRHSCDCLEDCIISLDEEVAPTTVSVARLAKPKRNLLFVQNKHVTFVWGESNCGQKKDGPQSAPPLICTESFLEVIEKLGWETSILHAHQIYKPIPEGVKTHLHEPYSVYATCQDVRDKVSAVLDAGNFPMLIGGDHCLSLGSVAASLDRYPDLGVIWFDAHADINTPDTSPSGNMHGMPLAALMDLPGIRGAPGSEGITFPVLRPERVAYIGLRDVDEGEWEIIKELGISCAFTVDDLKEHGMTELVRRVMEKLNPNGDVPMHLSFDVDGMDPIDAPSTGTPVADGVRIHEAIEMLQAIRDTGCLVSMDVVEVNPSLGTDFEAQLTIANARLVLAHGLKSTSVMSPTVEKGLEK